MFNKILIANRGEIACRVAKTARRMGIATVAVYSDADANARHVALCDEAWHIGAAPARESYLRIDAILAAAKASGAQAIHPGYGFLSENAEFADACAKAGLVFIGPPASAIRAMGSKSAAKAIMAKAKVPLVPGYHGEDQDAALLRREADKIGYPVLIKASAGGGGKGIRVVERGEDFAAALASCQREAKSSFSDARVLLEKYLVRPRHIEIQVFADTYGDCVYLFERDCSVQRRHQKVLEEAPAPGMTAARRQAMGEAAVAAAQAIGYVGAGTVEFIADQSGAFCFMEMNTRLQVEHPVTEMITGQDLVEWQLRVASGQHLPLKQSELKIHGHAIEARVYAEDPDRNFLPSIGQLVHLRTPPESAHVRVDTGVRQGDEISMHYDPMIAKLIVWDHSREAALVRMQTALGEYEVVGVTTNIAFLGRVIASKAFAGADLDTGLIERSRSELFPPPAVTPPEVLALAAMAELVREQEAATARARASGDPHSPWHICDGWRLNQDNFHIFHFSRSGSKDGGGKDETSHPVTVHYRGTAMEIELPGGTAALSGTMNHGGTIRGWFADRYLEGRVIKHGRTLDVFLNGAHHTLALDDRTVGELDTGTGGSLASPMPGKVIALIAAIGDPVEKGAPLLILEAMKMEHTIAAPAAGTVKAFNYAVGDQVQEGVELVAFEPKLEQNSTSS
jgi:3-methylcrotonyl-CoA carboxylase alpha subunit